MRLTALKETCFTTRAQSDTLTHAHACCTLDETAQTLERIFVKARKEVVAKRGAMARFANTFCARFAQAARLPCEVQKCFFRTASWGGHALQPRRAKKKPRRGAGKRLRPSTFHVSCCALPLRGRDEPKNHPQALQEFLSKLQLGIEPPFPPRILAAHRASPDTPL